MNKLKILILLTLLSLAGFALASPTGPSPVKNFNIERYQGLWHELSAIPASFQIKCVANTTAEYTLLPKGLIKVVNSCDQKNGKRKDSEARARVNKDFGLDSTLEVTFVKIFKWIWTFGGDYWVTYINDEYDVAIVGHPEYEFGWILSKNKSLSLNEYSSLSNELIAQGYDPCAFIMSKTPEQEFPNETPLCDLNSDTD
jgi:apolipoprotein D and lipocalin family protein